MRAKVRALMMDKVKNMNPDMATKIIEIISYEVQQTLEDFDKDDINIEMRKEDDGGYKIYLYIHVREKCSFEHERKTDD